MKLLIKKNRIFLLVFVLSCGAMFLPTIIGYGGSNVFLKDFLAKRLMTIFALPFFLVIFSYLFSKTLKAPKSINWFIYLYFFIWLGYLGYSVLSGNSLGYVFVDAFVCLLPILFIVPIRSFEFKFSEKFFYLLIGLTLLLTAFNIKLQFSYFNLIGVVVIIFVLKFGWKTLPVFLLLPLVLKNALLGKSAVIMLLILLMVFFAKKYEFIPNNRKKRILYLALFATIFASPFVLKFLTNNDAYYHFLYFIKNTNFVEFKFNDNSTGQRIYEAQRVLENFGNQNFIMKFIGEGYGAVLDFSNTPDRTIVKTNSDITRVHHIHIGLFAVLFRYGILGTLIFLGFVISIGKRAILIIKDSQNLVAVLCSLYVLILLFDSFVSFPHMMSNFLFWYCVGIVFLYTDKPFHSRVVNLDNKF